MSFVRASADQTLLMLDRESYVCGEAADVLAEDHLHQLYGVEMRRVNFEFKGEILATLTPVYPGLRRRRKSA